jgi:hypothetical protein
MKNLLLSNGNVFTEPFPRNGRCLHSHRLVTGLYATIYLWSDLKFCLCVGVGVRAVKMWIPLLITRNLVYENSFYLSLSFLLWLEHRSGLVSSWFPTKKFCAYYLPPLITFDKDFYLFVSCCVQCKQGTECTQ